MVKTALATQGTWVRSLVRELRSHMIHNTADGAGGNREEYWGWDASKRGEEKDVQGTWMEDIEYTFISCLY